MEELHHYLRTTKRCKERIGRSWKKTYDILNVYFKNVLICDETSTLDNYASVSDNKKGVRSS